MANVIRTVIAFRRAHTEEWLQYKDVIPAEGEPCFDLDLHTLKIGDGVQTYENLPAIGGVKVELDADGKSLVLEDGVFKLVGFEAAEVGAQPRKGADGKIEWIVPSTETVDGLKSTVAGLQSDITNLQTTVVNIQEIVTPSEGETLLSRVETLENKMDGTGEGTVDAKIDAKINEFAARVTDDGTINTIQELVTYVANHGGEVANITADILELQGLVGNTSVAEQIAAAGHMTKVEAEETLLSKIEAAKVLQHVEYEISSKPVGTLVDYNDKEIRVMCPVDTQFELQNSGEGSDASKYYIGFKAYAPEGAASFKEDLAEIIADDTMYYFEGNEFAGVDAYGRKYSIVWLPVANYVDGVWTYYGANSSNEKYIGWHYSVEWYDANGAKIDSDCIRINLSNENCHNVVEPYYMAGVVKGVSVGDTVLDIVNNNVVIPVGAGLKGSEEIEISEDGSIKVVSITWDKIAEGAGDLVLDGGSAAG